MKDTETTTPERTRFMVEWRLVVRLPDGQVKLTDHPDARDARRSGQRWIDTFPTATYTVESRVIGPWQLVPAAVPRPRRPRAKKRRH